MLGKILLILEKIIRILDIICHISFLLWECGGSGWGRHPSMHLWPPHVPAQMTIPAQYTHADITHIFIYRHI